MAELDIQRKMPFSLEAEQAVLGSVLIDPERIGDLAGKLTENDFYLEEHRQIYSAMQKLFLQSRDIDLVTLIDTLVKDGVYEKERCVSYMKVIAEIVPTASNLMDYAEIVKDKSLLRRLIGVCDEVSGAAFAEQDEARSVLDLASNRIDSLADDNRSGDFVHISDLLVQTYKQLDDLMKNGESLGTKTGYSGLDDLLVGMAAGDLILVGARPGMGKTAFALNIATNVARQSKKAVCIFSLEMSNVQLVSRILSSEALVDSHDLRSGKLSDTDWKKLADVSAYLSECNILIDDTPGITVAGMKAKLRRVKNLGLIVVDYLGLMQSDRKIDNKVQEVAEISRSLKLMAKELGVPLICCAQLSRGPESRTDKRPMLSDLRDSGAIEQDADMVLFLYRDEYYKEVTDPAKQNVAEVIISKNRHGSVGTVKLGWYGKYTKFSTLSNQEEPM